MGCSNMNATAAALLVVAGMTAQAAEPKTLMLACRGMHVARGFQSDKDAYRPFSTDLVVDLEAKTIKGFLLPLNIKVVSESTLHFGGSRSNDRTDINGTISRLTGDLEATVRWVKDGQVFERIYRLKCTPAERMF
jgi:hypothetical protein